VVATVGEHPAIVVAEHGSGTVIAVSDVGMLGNGMQDPPVNLTFWQNLAELAR
jgi:hypothetical protein